MTKKNKLLKKVIALKNKLLKKVVALKDKLMKSVMPQAALNLRTTCIQSQKGTQRHQHLHKRATLRYKMLHNEGVELTVHEYVQLLSHSATLPGAIKHAIQTPKCSLCKDGSSVH